MTRAFVPKEAEDRVLWGGSDPLGSRDRPGSVGCRAATQTSSVWYILLCKACKQTCICTPLPEGSSCAPAFGGH